MSHFARKPTLQLSSAPADMLQVLDMGLDFRSYLKRVDEHGSAYLGNVISFPASKVVDVFEPTLGLLVTLLHLYVQSSTAASAKCWLVAFDGVEKLYLESPDTNPEGAKYAIEARAAIQVALSSGHSGPDPSLCEKLLILLDFQSSIRGSQAPSQRKIPREPKGAFCNLHLSDHKCYQEFACNQLHLHESGPVRHRIAFFVTLIDVLRAEGMSREQILYRVKDSLFFARYGNRVTVSHRGGWIPFFKTQFTVGRLEHALRTNHGECMNAMCENENCRGIHLQDRRFIQSTKQMDLQNPSLVLSELNEEAEHLLAFAEAANKPPPQELRTSPLQLNSPTSEQWQTTVREYVRQSGIAEVQADEGLLLALQDTRAGTPSISTDSFTPLLNELNGKDFDASVSFNDD